jgi:hypothetical protein
MAERESHIWLLESSIAVRTALHSNSWMDPLQSESRLHRALLSVLNCLLSPSHRATFSAGLGLRSASVPWSQYALGIPFGSIDFFALGDSNVSDGAPNR